MRIYWRIEAHQPNKEESAMPTATTTVNRVKSFVIDAENKPGVLAQYLKGLRDGGVNLRGLWGFATMGGNAKIHCIPEDEGKFLAACKKMGREPRTRTSFQVSGEDRVGALCELLDKIAAANINFNALDAISAGNGFGAYIWGDRTNSEALAKTLGV
jgi:prephenate dehydratase